MHDAFNHLQLPSQHLEKLSLCEPTPQAMSEWLLQQPLEDNRRISVLLFALMPELNQLACANHSRIDMLDIIRPVVYRSVASSHKTFLKQSLHLDTQATRIAIMSHALLRHLSDGYLVAIRDEQIKEGIDLTLLSKCIFFALHSLSQLYFHCAQMYGNTPPLFWLKVHCLYQLASDYDIIDQVVPAYHSPDENRTIAQAYKRLIMLACSHTNELPQVDIGYLYQAFEDWADMANIVTDPIEKAYDQCRHWASLQEDTGPHNRVEHKGECDIGFDFTDIVLLLQTHNHYAPGNAVKEIPTFFRHSLAEHILQHWQRNERRKQARQTINERFEICVGLDSAYALLNGSDEKQSSFVNAVDSSPGGLCLRWQHDIPEETEPGQCLLIRSPGKTKWRIGIIRWAHHLNQYTYAGIQLLSEHVTPSAAKLYWQNGVSQESYQTITFDDQRTKPCATHLLLPKLLADDHERTIRMSLETHKGEETIEQLDKMTEFARVSHYTCTLSEPRLIN